MRSFLGSTYCRADTTRQTKGDVTRRYTVICLVIDHQTTPLQWMCLATSVEPILI